MKIYDIDDEDDDRPEKGVCVILFVNIMSDDE